MRTGATRALVPAATAALFAIAIPAQAQSQPSDPAAVFEAFEAARNNGDAAAAAALFGDTAVFIRAPATGPCSRQSPCIGRAAILLEFQMQVGVHDCETTLDQTVVGSVVVAHQEVRTDALRANGIERVVIVTTALVDQGRITALYGLYDLSDPETATSNAISAGLQPPGAPIPNPPTACG